jgi:hypothetical protein
MESTQNLKRKEEEGGMVKKEKYRWVRLITGHYMHVVENHDETLLYNQFMLIKIKNCLKKFCFLFSCSYAVF